MSLRILSKLQKFWALIIYIHNLMASCEMKTHQVQVYIQQLFHDELQEAKCIYKA